MIQLTYPYLKDFEKFVQQYVPSISNLQNVITTTLGAVFEQYNEQQPYKYGVFCANGNNSLIGIDIPVLVDDGNPKDPKEIIAIVSQDPLRNANDRMLPNSGQGVIVGTPFALHYEENCYPQTEVYRDIIKKLLQKGYAVYLTDARKIYPNMKGKKIGISFLRDELSRIQPKYIITLGSVAKDYLSVIKNRISKPGYQCHKIINLLHPSQTNWDHWKQWIFEQAYYGTTGYSKLAGMIPKRNGMFDKQTTSSPMPSIITQIVDNLIP